MNGTITAEMRPAIIGANVEDRPYITTAKGNPLYRKGQCLDWGQVKSMLAGGSMILITPNKNKRHEPAWFIAKRRGR